MDEFNFSGYNRTEEWEGEYKDADPRMETSQGTRQTFATTSWQPPAHGDQIAALEASVKGALERITKVENEMIETKARLQHLESRNRVFPGGAVKKELQEKEENEKLKEKIKKLEERNAVLLSKAMAMHKDSEDMNDPSRLSAVLQRYEMLRLHDWEKVRMSPPYSWAYEQSRQVIKKLFDACEKDMQKRTAEIFDILGISSVNDAMTNSKQGIMREIRNLFGQPCYQSHSEVYNKIIKKAGINTKYDSREFLLQCCQIYCLLLLQDPPVKAEWNIEARLPQYVEHVDKKDVMYWKNPVLLWPVMKCGEQIIVKGVVWD